MKYRWPTIVLAALSVGMVAAIVAPRYTSAESIDWLAFVVAAVLTGVAVALATRERVDPGRTVRDDVLPPE